MLYIKMNQIDIFLHHGDNFQTQNYIKVQIFICLRNHDSNKYLKDIQILYKTLDHQLEFVSITLLDLYD